jgi:hypothetical protein
MAVARNGFVSMDCADPLELGEFWAAMLGGDIAFTAEAERLGARPAATQPAPDRWRVMFDPAGHPFCLTTQIPPEAR